MTLVQELVFAGVVMEGRRLGRTIGFPTANLDLPDEGLPAFGVFAALTLLPDGRTRGGVANLGRRPTVGGGAAVLEVHLFDLDEDLYGQRLEVRLVRRLRDERRFPGLDALRVQIELDATAARAVLSVAAT
jgi:riboflavin kinase/FMN adenylyltransferase